MSTLALFDPPSRSTRKNRSRSLRSLKAKASRPNFKPSNSSKDSLFSDLLGIKSRHTPTEITGIEDSPPLDFSSSASIASGSTETTTASSSSSSSSSTASTATKASSISLTDHDLFGIRLKPTPDPQASQVRNAVELGEQTYQVPEPIEKQFYRDLTFMEDQELVQKYGLVKLDSSSEIGATEGEDEKREGYR